MVGPYALLERLGGGGHGAVFRARDGRDGREVAVKLLHDRHGSRERALIEARAAGRLEHPNLASIEEAGTDAAGRPYLVMPLYRGRSLAERLREGRLEPEEAVGLAAQAARGLAAAHAAGVVHRDVKPENLMVCDDGRVRVLDFGMAELRDDDAHADPEGVAGSLPYLAPEQVKGLPSDPRCDVWALGVVLYEALTGTHPFADGDSVAATVLAIVDPREAPPASSRAPGLPARLDGVLARALAKSPERRYATMEAFLAALEHAGDPAEAPVPHNLAPAGEPLLGRDAERRTAHIYLDDPGCRLLTLTGSGGIGKSRLAEELAREEALRGGAEGGVYFVALERARERRGALQRVAEALGAKPGEDPLRAVADALGDRRVLLVLDNLEQVAGAADAVRSLLEAVPGLRAVVTSRRRLGLDGEWVLPLHGLALPTADADDPAAAPAVALFLARARQLEPDWRPDRDELAAVADICRLVGGSPLGIALAAAWVDTLGCRDIAAQIRSDLDFLSSENEALPPRHRSIRAVFEHAWRRLEPAQRDALRALAVVRTPFDAAAAGAVAGADAAMLESLAEAALLQRGRDGRHWRHPLLMQFMREELGRDDDAAREARRRHAAHYTEVAAGLLRRLRGRDQPAALRELDDRLEDVAEAWRWRLAHGPHDGLHEATEALWVYFDEGGRLGEGVEMMGEALDGLGDSGPLAGTLRVCRGWLRLRLGDIAGARLDAECGLALAAGVTRTELWALNTLGAAAGSSGDLDGARDYLARAVEAADRQDDDTITAALLSNLAIVERRLGRYEAARRTYERSLALAVEHGHETQVLRTMNNLGALLLSLERWSEARGLLELALEKARRLRLERLRTTLVGNLGRVALALGDLDAARLHLDEALALARAHGERAMEATVAIERGAVARGLGRPDEAREHLAAGLRAARADGRVSVLLQGAVRAAELARDDGRPHEAALLAAAALERGRLEPEFRPAAEALLAALAGELEPDVLAAARAEAASLPLERLTELALLD